MTLEQAIKMALNILEPFKESSLYDDYQEVDRFTDDEYEEMLKIFSWYGKDAEVAKSQ